MARKKTVKKVDGEAFDDDVPDPNVVDEAAFAELREQWLEEEDDG